MLVGLVATFALMGAVANWSTWVTWMDLHAGVASWVQAIGTIAAIYWAAATALSLFEKEGARRAEESRQVRRARLAAVSQVVEEAHALLIFACLTAKKHDPVQWETIEAVVPGISRRIAEIPLFELPDANLVSSLSLARFRVNEAAELAGILKSKPKELAKEVKKKMLPVFEVGEGYLRKIRDSLHQDIAQLTTSENQLDTAPVEAAGVSTIEAINIK